MCIVTPGLERAAERVFFASGKWRTVDRFPWWNEYREAIPAIIGHYWRWPTVAARNTYSRGELWVAVVSGAGTPERLEQMERIIGRL